MRDVFPAALLPRTTKLNKLNHTSARTKKHTSSAIHSTTTSTPKRLFGICSNTTHRSAASVGTAFKRCTLGCSASPGSLSLWPPSGAGSWYTGTGAGAVPTSSSVTTTRPSSERGMDFVSSISKSPNLFREASFTNSAPWFLAASPYTFSHVAQPHLVSTSHHYLVHHTPGVPCVQKKP